MLDKRFTQDMPRKRISMEVTKRIDDMVDAYSDMPSDQVTWSAKLGWLVDMLEYIMKQSQDQSNTSATRQTYDPNRRY
jgi:hypothetical protein